MFQFGCPDQELEDHTRITLHQDHGRNSVQKVCDRVIRYQRGDRQKSEDEFSGTFTTTPS